MDSFYLCPQINSTIQRFRNAYLDSDFAWKFNQNEMRLRPIWAFVFTSQPRTKGRYLCTYCQKVSGSSSRRHSVPNPYLYEETDHLACDDISGNNSSSGDDSVSKAGKLMLNSDPKETFSSYSKLDMPAHLQCCEEGSPWRLWGEWLRLNSVDSTWE